MKREKPILFHENPPQKNTNGLYCYVEHTAEKICGFFGEYFFLSNGKKCPIYDPQIPDLIYPFSENAYQASKFEDTVLRKMFQEIDFKQAIELAWTLRKNIKHDWESIKLFEMKRILTQKFNDINLKQKLKETGNKYLEETNHWKDTFWGVCEGIGENNLGKILMDIRSEIE